MMHPGAGGSTTVVVTDGAGVVVGVGTVDGISGGVVGAEVGHVW